MRRADMVVVLNGKEIETEARTLDELVAEQVQAGQKIATALNGHFVPAAARRDSQLKPGDRVEIVSPRQGG